MFKIYSTVFVLATCAPAAASAGQPISKLSADLKAGSTIELIKGVSFPKDQNFEKFQNGVPLQANSPSDPLKASCIISGYLKLKSDPMTISPTKFKIKEVKYLVGSSTNRVFIGFEPNSEKIAAIMYDAGAVRSGKGYPTPNLAQVTAGDILKCFNGDPQVYYIDRIEINQTIDITGESSVDAEKINSSATASVLAK